MRRALSLVAVAALIAGACDGGGPDPSANPKDALVSAFRSLGDAQGLSLRFSLRSDTGSLQALAADDGPELSEEDAQKILDSSLTMSTRDEDDPAQSQAEIRANVAGRDDAVELRVVGDDLYARADVRGLMEEFGQDPAQADRFVQQAQRAGVGFAEPAVNGEWLGLQNVEQVIQQLTGQQVQQTPSPADDEIFEEFADAVRQSAEVEEGEREGPGTHLVATINLRRVYSHIVELARRVSGTLPPGAFPPAQEVPDETIDLDAWVEDDFVRQLEFSFLQLEKLGDEDVPEGVNELALRLEIEEFTDEVTAPDDVTNIDPQEVFSLMFGAMGAQQQTQAPPEQELEDVCEELRKQGQPDEVLEQVGCET